LEQAKQAIAIGKTSTIQPQSPPRFYALAMPEALISVRVTPRSSRDEITGWQDGVLRVRLKAPPVDGRANVALCQFIASKLDLAARDVEVVSGATARTKRLRILGLTAAEVQARLG
jgi:uncharacterized protein